MVTPIKMLDRDGSLRTQKRSSVAKGGISPWNALPITDHCYLGPVTYHYRNIGSCIPYLSSSLTSQCWERSHKLDHSDKWSTPPVSADFAATAVNRGSEFQFSPGQDPRIPQTEAHI